MSTVIYGDRVGKLGTLSVGCSATIYDSTRRKVLLTRRADNGQWCLPGGHMEPGETAAEACAREVWEETGLRVRVGKLIGVYTDPHRVRKNADGKCYQRVALSFEAEPIGGELSISDETTEYGYFPLNDIKDMDVMENHYERLKDAFTGQDEAFVR